MIVVSFWVKVLPSWSIYAINILQKIQSTPKQQNQEHSSIIAYAVKKQLYLFTSWSFFSWFLFFCAVVLNLFWIPRFTSGNSKKERKHVLNVLKTFIIHHFTTKIPTRNMQRLTIWLSADITLVGTLPLEVAGYNLDH